MCAAAAAVATLRDLFDGSLLPLLAAGTIMVLATCRRHGHPVLLRKEGRLEPPALITMNAFVGIFFFIYVCDSAPAGSIFTVALTLPLCCR
jgi:hypothetical protein